MTETSEQREGVETIFPLLERYTNYYTDTQGSAAKKISPKARRPQPRTVVRSSMLSCFCFANAARVHAAKEEDLQVGKSEPSSEPEQMSRELFERRQKARRYSVKRPHRSRGPVYSDEYSTYEVTGVQKARVGKHLRETLASLEQTPPVMHFQALRATFFADEVLSNAVHLWESGQADALWLDATCSQAALGALPATLPVPRMRGKPIFQCFLEQIEAGTPLHQVFPTIVYCDSECMVFSPAGFKGNQKADETLLKAAQGDAQAIADGLTRTPLTMNPTSLNKGKGAALMSHAHLLVIPRRRIYNAVTLKESHINLVKHMEKVGRAAVRSLLQADGCMPNGTVEPLERVPADLDELASASYLPGGLGMSQSSAAKLASDIATTFHVYPQQSIGWLHMHAFSGSMLTRAFDLMDDLARQKLVATGKKPCGANDTRTGFPKNIPSSVIVAMLEGTPARVPLPPVDINQVMRANDAAVVIQHAARTLAYRKSDVRSSRGHSFGSSTSLPAGSGSQTIHRLRDMPRASMHRQWQPGDFLTRPKSSFNMLASEAGALVNTPKDRPADTVMTPS